VFDRRSEDDGSDKAAVVVARSQIERRVTGSFMTMIKMSRREW
jgi:hypothetical protein